MPARQAGPRREEFEERLRALGSRLRAAREAEARVLAEIGEVVPAAFDQRISDRDIERLSGMSRMTVRARLREAGRIG